MIHNWLVKAGMISKYSRFIPDFVAGLSKKTGAEEVGARKLGGGHPVCLGARPGPQTEEEFSWWACAS